MILADILADEIRRNYEFPVVESGAYLAHAAVSPLPRRVTEAMRDYLEQVTKRGQFEYLHRESEEGTRQKFATLLDVQPDEIALMPSTSASLGTVAEGLDWQPSDTVIIKEGDFPSNNYPWLALSRRGVNVKKIPYQSDRSVTVEDVLAQVDESTRLVSLASIDYLTGAPIDLDAIGQALQERGVLFCVDAIQSLGAIKTSARYVDFLAADAHKWLLGPQGIGTLMVNRKHWERLSPVLRGWKSVAQPGDFHNLQEELATGAKRYEPGSLNAVGIVGLNAALELILEIGMDSLEKQICELRESLRQQLSSSGMMVLGSERPQIASGIISFRPEDPQVDVREFHRLLLGQGFEISLRTDLNEVDWLRTAPHFYNTQAEVDRLVASVISGS